MTDKFIKHGKLQMTEKNTNQCFHKNKRNKKDVNHSKIQKIWKIIKLIDFIFFAFQFVIQYMNMTLTSIIGN